MDGWRYLEMQEHFEQEMGEEHTAPCRLGIDEATNPRAMMSRRLTIAKNARTSACEGRAAYTS